MKTTFKTEFYRVHIEMIRSVVTFAINDIAITESVPAFYNNIVRLETNLAAIDTLKQTAQQQITGFAANKKALKASLVETGTTIMQAVYSYALETNNAVLAAQMSATFTKLNRMAYPALVNFAQDSINIITPLIASLSDYNVTGTTVAAWQANITALGAALSSANNAIAHRRAANEQIQTLLQQSMVILTNNADALSLQIKKISPAYYSEYRANRKLKPTGHVSTQLRLTVTDELKQPVTTGEVYIIGTDRTAALNENGYALVDHIPHGVHAISVTTPFGTYNYAAIRFKLGKSRTLHVQINVNADNIRGEEAGSTFLEKTISK